MKKKLNQIISKLPALICTGCGYIGCARVVEFAKDTDVGAGLRTFYYLCFMLTFALFWGLIISLLDLKYIGHRFTTGTKKDEA